MVEDHLYFRQYNFHKKKLLLHRASMKFYQQYLQDKNYTVKYIDAFSQLSALNNLFQQLRIDKIVEVNYCDTADYLLERRLKRYGNKNHIQLNKFDSPGFLNSQRDLQNYFGKTDHYFLHDFYKHERNRLSVLIKDNKPVGDRWSFDTENRKKLPKGVLPLPIAAVANDQYITEAQAYVQQHFPGNLGSESEFNFPVTYEDAENRLDDFLKNRFDLFGPFQDAMQEKEPFLFHSVLSSSLNTGLITPDYVVDKVLQYAEEAKIPMPSVEGFIRQIIGWREFMRGVYQYKGVYQRKSNFWQHTRKISASFYTGTTGIVPIDAVIKRLLQHAYAHHIERLMVIGNFMLLCEFHPDEVYCWFMQFFIDAYDWVMVTNVYAMSQFADGGTMSTKPYFSGSNYILKMSDYKPGEWSNTWNALYWRFIYIHKDFFAKNQRMRMITTLLNKMDEKILKSHLATADAFLESLQ